MKYLVTFNVLDKRGRNTPVRASVEVKDLARPAAIAAALDYMCKVGVLVVSTPSSVQAVSPPRRRPHAMASFERRVKDFEVSQRGKVRLPRL